MAGKLGYFVVTEVFVVSEVFVASELARAGLRSSPKTVTPDTPGKMRRPHWDRFAVQREQARSPQGEWGSEKGGVLTMLMGLPGWLFGGRLSTTHSSSYRCPQRNLLDPPYRSIPKVGNSKIQEPGSRLAKNHKYRLQEHRLKC